MEYYLLQGISVGVRGTNRGAFANLTLAFNNDKGLKYNIYVDDEIPQVVEVHKDKSQKEWNKMVADNVKILTTNHKFNTIGKSTNKII